MNSSIQSNDSFWLETLEALSPEVAQFTDRFPASDASKFQIKWNTLGSIFSRSLKGTLRHLPTGESVKFNVRLPI